MKLVSQIFQFFHGLLAALFGVGAVMLTIIAARIGWNAFIGGGDAIAAQKVIEAIGLLAAAVVALQIAETITAEELMREADVSAPTRVRRYLSRFFVVVIVALAIEGLVATFHALHVEPTHMPYAASLIAAVGVLLAAWGVFVRSIRYAEELEPEAMADVKREDQKIKEEVRD